MDPPDGSFLNNVVIVKQKRQQSIKSKFLLEDEKDSTKVLAMTKALARKVSGIFIFL